MIFSVEKSYKKFNIQSLNKIRMDFDKNYDWVFVKLMFGLFVLEISGFGYYEFRVLGSRSVGFWGIRVMGFWI